MAGSRAPEIEALQLIKGNSHLATEELNVQVMTAIQDPIQLKSMPRAVKTMEPDSSQGSRGLELHQAIHHYGTD